MKNIDPPVLITLSRVFSEMNDAEAAALLAVMAAPTAQHKDIAERFSVNTKAITRPVFQTRGHRHAAERGGDRPLRRRGG